MQVERSNKKYMPKRKKEKRAPDFSTIYRMSACRLDCYVSPTWFNMFLWSFKTCVDVSPGDY